MSPHMPTDTQTPSNILQFPSRDNNRNRNLQSSLPRRAFRRPNGPNTSPANPISSSISYFEGHLLDLAKDLGVPTNRREARKLAQVLNSSLGVNQHVPVAVLLYQPLAADNITAITNVIEDTVLRLGLHAPSRFDNWCFLLNCLIEDAMAQDCG